MSFVSLLFIGVTSLFLSAGRCDSKRVVLVGEHGADLSSLRLAPHGNHSGNSDFAASTGRA